MARDHIGCLPAPLVPDAQGPVGVSGRGRSRSTGWSGQRAAERLLVDADHGTRIVATQAEAAREAHQVVGLGTGRGGHTQFVRQLERQMEVLVGEVERERGLVLPGERPVAELLKDVAVAAAGADHGGELVEIDAGGRTQHQTSAAAAMLQKAIMLLTSLAVEPAPTSPMRIGVAANERGSGR